MSDNYIPGEVARISITVAAPTGLASDPGALRLKVKPPAGAVVTYAYGSSGEIIKDATGRYHADILLAAAGLWAYRWELDAPNAGAVEGAITVQKSRVI
jgi:hypothetical protein